MKSYYITVPITKVTGTATFFVEAKNKREAIARLKAGDGTETQRDIEDYEVDHDDQLSVEEG